MGRVLVCGGDFNTVRSSFKRNGCLFGGVGIDDFNSFINEGQLIDILLVGMQFTWFGIENKRSRLDRFIVSIDWVSHFRGLAQTVGLRLISDHVPIFLGLENVNWGPSPFKFLNCWFLHKIFLSVVQ
ncbi:hypothetical protein REPUB_Repub09cG0003500 [Reevesia pubescens]